MNREVVALVADDPVDVCEFAVRAAVIIRHALCAFCRTGVAGGGEWERFRAANALLHRI
jgi:hypothetical protein